VNSAELPEDNDFPEIWPELPPEPRLRDLPFKLLNLPRFVCLGMIRGYQMTLSRLLPANTCRFYPTCSEYFVQALQKYGFFKGTWLGLKRISKCHPWHEGGYDPLK